MVCSVLWCCSCVVVVVSCHDTVLWCRGVSSPCSTQGAFGCAEQLLRGQATDMYVRYVMRWCNLLLDHRIKPILVFDGSNLPSKKVTEDKRRKKRKEARELAVQLMKEGGPSDALHRAMQMSMDITPPMARSEPSSSPPPPSGHQASINCTTRVRLPSEPSLELSIGQTSCVCRLRYSALKASFICR